MSRDESPMVREQTPDEGYTYTHRAFLQAFMTRNVMTVDEIKPVLANVMTAHSKSLHQISHYTSLTSYQNQIAHGQKATSRNHTSHPRSKA